MPLPDFGDERCFRRQLAQLLAQCGPIDIAFADLHAFAVYADTVDEVQVDGVRRQLCYRFRQRNFEEVACKHGVRNVQAEGAVVGAREFGGVLRVKEEVVVLLPAHQPGVGRQSLCR